MINLKPRIAILGGGIRGAAIAALLAQSNECKVMLFERDRIASGTSSTNHGRVHCGAGLWRKNLDQMAHRHHEGGKLIRQLSANIGQQEAGLYLVESPHEVLAFEKACQQYAIPYRQIHGQNFWVDTNQFAAAFEIPEYAFSPAQLAARLAGYAEDMGASIFTRSEVQSIGTGATRAFSIHLANGVTIEVDVIINALGSWTNDIRSDLPLPRVNLSLHSWKILCLYSPTMLNGSTSNRVITVVESEDIVPSMIPHMPWLIFGCRLEPDILTSPDEKRSEKWNSFNMNNNMDRMLFEVHSRYFTVLQTFSDENLMKRLYTFSGVYPTFAGVYPNYDKQQENTFQLLHNESVPDYYVVCGENATTSLIDAVDTVQMIVERISFPHTPSSTYAFHLLNALNTNLTHQVHYDSSLMIWEKAHVRQGAVSV